jgi:cytochrome c
MKLILLSIIVSTVLSACGNSDRSSDSSSPGTKSKTDEIVLYGIGKAASEEIIAGWDIDVRPDGLGLPAGSGSVEDGEMLYDDKCAACHGTFGEGENRWPKLAGGEGTLSDERPEKTVGSYWPYASTLWDYINRAMPFPEPQSLAVDEVYAITAYVLSLNEIVDDEFVLSDKNLALIEMPNQNGFYVDDRPDASNERCMKDCLDPNAMKIVASLSGVSPTDHFKEDGNDGVVFKEKPVSADIDSVAMQTYDAACKLCHGAGLAGAPKVGVYEDWLQRLEKGNEAIYQNALNGFKGMPAKGGRADLSDEMVKSVVDYMLQLSQAE